MSFFYSAIAFSLVLLWPFTIGATRFLGTLFRAERAADNAPDRLTLVRVLYLVGIVGAIVQTVLALIALLALGGQRQLVAILAPAIYAALPILGALPIPAALYLKWLTGREP